MNPPPTPAGWEPGPAAPPALAPGDVVHLWLAEIAAGGPDSEAILRAVLARYLDEDPEALRFATAPGGKPQLAERPERLRFNLSHSGELVLVAVATVEIGVDVQRVEPRRSHLAIAERRLDATAAAAVRAAPDADRAAVFTTEWAIFEARQKCLGIGVFDTAPDQAAVAVTTIAVPAGYAAAIAVEGEQALEAQRFRLT
jgi:hypothetical protein